MRYFLFLILTIRTATLAAPHPQATTDGEIFDDDDYDGVEDNYEGEVEDTVECDIFPDEECDTTTEAVPPKEECKPKATEQFLIDLRSSERTSNDCNKTAKCIHYRGEGYSCVPYWQCKNTDSKVISDGFGVIDLRKDAEEDCVHKVGTLDASDGKCPDKESHVCCKNANIDAEICKPRKGRDGPTTTESPIVTVMSKSSETASAKPVTLGSHSNCGRTGSKTKVTNLDDKNAAQPGEFPHMCIVYTKDKRVYLGGASLIDKNKVISVAHKFYLQHGEKNTIDERENVENLLVRCGEYNVKTEAELLDYQETSVVAIHVHPLYKPNLPYLPNNLVILQTKENFIYQDHIGPVCLPEPDTDFKDAECWSSGWGKDAFGAIGYYSDVLKKVDMPIVDSNKCESDLRRAIMNKTGSSTTNFRLDESHLCVGGVPDKDTCTGHGGSPHSCKIDGRWIQVGVVAWGFGCGDNIPAIYSSIPDAMCWIHHLLTCVGIAEKNVNGEIDDLDLVDLRSVLLDCEKYTAVLTSCSMYENQQGFDREV